MPTFEITAPGGAIYHVDAPDGATEQDALAHFQQQMAPPEPKAPFVRPPDALDDPNMATAGMSLTDKFNAGMGKAFTDLGRGALQLIPGLGPSGADVADMRRRDAPLLNTGAGMAGNLVGAAVPALAATAAAPALLGTYAGAAGLGAAQGLLTPSESTGEKLLNAGIGGAAGAVGQGAANLAGRVIAPFRPNLTPSQASTAAKFVDMGGQMTPGQQTGSTLLKGIESGLESFPPTSGVIAGVKANNQAVTNRAVAAALGETGDSVDDALLSNAHTRLSGIFDAARDSTPVQLGTSQMNALAGIENATRGTLGAPLADHPLVNEALEQVANGTATREQLGSLSTRLRQASQSQFTSATGNRPLGMALGDVKDVVEQALQDSLPADQQAEYQTARTQYRNLMTVLSRPSVVNSATGDVSGRNLAAVLAAKDRTGYTFGGNQGDMHTAARFAKAFADMVGNSGTATRAALPYAVTGLTGAIAGGASSDDPVRGAMKGLGAGVAAPALANVLAKGYMSGPMKSYLTGAMAPTSATGKALAAALQKALVSGAISVPALAHGAVGQ